MDQLLAVDTETYGLEFFDQPFGLSWANEKVSGYVDLRTAEDSAIPHALLQQSSCLVFHNAKFDIQKLQLAGILPRRKRVQFHDTEALAHLLDEHQIKKLKPLARKFLGLEDDEAQALRKERERIKKERGLRSIKEVSYADIPRSVLEPYAIKDAEYTWGLFNEFWPELRRYPELVALYDLERELLWGLLSMEWAGMAVDLEYADRAAKDYAGRAVKAEWAIEKATGLKVWYPEKSGQKTPDGCFNPNSNPQIADYFRGKGHRFQKYDKFTLPKIEDPMAKAILDLRAAHKMRNTYLLPMMKEQVDGILHPHFRQHGARTGRMSSGAAEES